MSYKFDSVYAPCVKFQAFVTTHESNPISMSVITLSHCFVFNFCLLKISRYGCRGLAVDPLGGNKFSAYYQTERGRSGLDKDINLERMGMIYKTAFHRFRPVFRGDKRSGKLAFAIISQDVKSVTLSVQDFILAFNPSGGAESTIDFEFKFDVKQGIVKTELDPLY